MQEGIKLFGNKDRRNMTMSDIQQKRREEWRPDQSKHSQLIETYYTYSF